jgi:hypothetical protein
VVWTAVEETDRQATGNRQQATSKKRETRANECREVEKRGGVMWWKWKWKGKGKERGSKGRKAREGAMMMARE